MLKNGLIILTLLVSTTLFSQDDDSYVYGDEPTTTDTEDSSSKGFDWSKTSIGGGFYLQFGTNTYVLIAPTFSYRLTQNFTAGIGVGYIYESSTNPNYPFYSANTYSGSIFTQYTIAKTPIMLHAELEMASININYKDEAITDLQFNLFNPYVGGGLKQKMGSNSFLYAMILYNLNETKESNYFQTNPIVRIGVIIGL